MLTRLKQLSNSALKHQGFRRYFANTSWLFAEQILRIIAGLLVGIYVARYLGPEKFGLFNYVIAFVAIFSAIAKLGLDGIIVRDLVNAPEKRDIYLGTGFWIKILGAVAAILVILVAVSITGNDYTTKLYIVLIATGLVFQSSEVVDYYFQSRVLAKYVSISKISQLLLSSLLKIYFVAINADLFWFVLVSVIDQASLAAALAYAYSKQKIGAFSFKFDRNAAREMLQSAKPLIISGILVSAYSSMDRVIIKEMLGVREVGIYAAAAGLVTAFNIVPRLIANSLFPAILNAKKQSEQLYNRRLSLLYKNILAFGLMVSLLVTVFAGSITSFLYGPDFSNAAAVLQIYIWNFLLICFSSIFGKWLLSENLQHLTPRFTLMAIVVNIAGCIVLIPFWSIKGAAIAALGSQLIPLIWFGISNKDIQSQIKCALALR